VSRAFDTVGLTVVGLSHHTAPLDVRERFVCGGEVVTALRGALGGDDAHALLLSTCNRTELYIASAAGDEAAIAAKRTLLQRAGYESGDGDRWLYVHRDRSAALHLCRVAAGLDSLVVGEAQIQGQVRDAYEQAARLAGARRPAAAVLGRLFDTALLVGGRVRAETALGVGAASVPSAAVELARKIFGSLAGRRAAVVGAGEMSRLALRCFTAAGVHHAVVAGRSRARAEQLAGQAGAASAQLADLPALIATCDIVVTATASPVPILTAQAARAALTAGRQGPLLIVDIAVPRNVEPAVGRLNDVFLYDLDDLRAVVDGTLDRRRDAIAQAEQIVLAGVEDFWNWHRGRRAVPLIRELRGRAERVREVELERAFRTLGHLPPDDRAAVENLTRQLIAKLLHSPTARLRKAAEQGRDAEVVALARYLFALDEEDTATRGRERAPVARNGTDSEE
jgi:glutamyl-tRNA reductase